MEKYNNLLSQISNIVEQEKVIREKAMTNGEYFNMFEILGVSRNEVSLHSALIADLLNPKSKHGLADMCLKCFLELNNIDIKFNIETVDVYVEYNIGPVSRDGNRGGRLDILIEDSHSHAIVIENKIDAGDQPSQLLRYHNFIQDNKKDGALIYLTKDGHEASEISTKGMDIEYKCLSYRTNIMKWLERCLSLSEGFPLVQNTIKQYIVNLKDILDIMDESISTKIVQIATLPENVEATLGIYANFYEIALSIRKAFINQLKDVANKYGFKCKDDEGIEEFKSNTWIYFYDERQSDRWAICIGNYSIGNSDGYRYGISNYEGRPLAKKYLKSVSDMQKFTNDPDQNFPLGWDYLFGEDGKTGDWWRWDNHETLRDMANGSIAKYLEENLFRMVSKDKLLQKLHKKGAKTEEFRHRKGSEIKE